MISSIAKCFHDERDSQLKVHCWSQEVMPAYARVHAAMFTKGGAAKQQVHFVQDDSRSVLAFTAAEYEVYALFDGLVEKSAAVLICQRLCAWIKGLHSEIFVPLSV